MTIEEIYELRVFLDSRVLATATPFIRWRGNRRKPTQQKKKGNNRTKPASTGEREDERLKGDLFQPPDELRGDIAFIGGLRTESALASCNLHSSRRTHNRQPNLKHATHTPGTPPVEGHGLSQQSLGRSARQLSSSNSSIFLPVVVAEIRAQGIEVQDEPQGAAHQLRDHFSAPADLRLSLCCRRRRRSKPRNASTARFPNRLASLGLPSPATGSVGQRLPAPGIFASFPALGQAPSAAGGAR